MSQDSPSTGTGVEYGGVDHDAAGEAAADGSLTNADGSVDRDAVLERATPVFDRWERDRHLDAARGRVGTVFAASVAVLALAWTTDPDGLTGVVLQLWSLASLPIAGVAGSLYVTLRNPRRARETWWDDGALLTLGLVLVAWLSRAAVRTAVGRVAWQLLFAEDSPTGARYGYDVADGVDEARVAELHGYVTYAVAGSVAVVVLDYAGRALQRGGLDALVDIFAGSGGVDPGTGGGAGGGAGAGGGLPALPALHAIPTDPLSIAAYLVVAVLVGGLLGFFVALRRDL